MSLFAKGSPAAQVHYVVSSVRVFICIYACLLAEVHLNARMQRACSGFAPRVQRTCSAYAARLSDLYTHANSIKTVLNTLRFEKKWKNTLIFPYSLFPILVILYLFIYSPNDKCLVIRTSLKPHKIYELKRET